MNWTHVATDVAAGPPGCIQSAIAFTGQHIITFTHQWCWPMKAISNENWIRMCAADCSFWDPTENLENHWTN